MRSRSVIHDDFVARFHVGERPVPVMDEQLAVIEQELRTNLPVAFRQFMTRHGAVYTPTIHDEIAEHDIEHSDIQNILAPEEAIEGTKGYWSAGMPEDVIGIASDCMGNMIGFRRRSSASDDSPVVYFDHDFVEVSQIAVGFDELLVWYLDHLKGQLTTTM